jgi:hypothetical protein
VMPCDVNSGISPIRGISRWQLQLSTHPLSNDSRPADGPNSLASVHWISVGIRGEALPGGWWFLTKSSNSTALAKEKDKKSNLNKNLEYRASYLSLCLQLLPVSNGFFIIGIIC